MISIVVPIYKVEKYLRRCLDSVVAQTFPDWEMILVDDGSPDQCGVICDEYADRDHRIRVIHQENGGLSVARNSGIEACRGDYLYFLDSDDYIDHDALKIMWDLAQKKNLDIVMAGHNRVEADGSIYCNSQDWIESYDACQIQEDILRNKLPNFAWGKLYKRQLWANLRFPAGILIEDMCVISNVFYQAERIALLPRPLYFYSHENPNSLMSSNGHNYVRLRYGKFLGWREHAHIAAKYCPQYEKECMIKAVHAAVRAVILSAGTNILGEQEKLEAQEYIRQQKNTTVTMSIALTRWVILTEWNPLVCLVGIIQRQLVDFQQKQRNKRRETGNR